MRPGGCAVKSDSAPSRAMLAKTKTKETNRLALIIILRTHLNGRGMQSDVILLVIGFLCRIHRTHGRSLRLDVREAAAIVQSLSSALLLPAPLLEGSQICL